jgi:glycosyltransferase involved in cell wall biosynthesis
MQNKLVSVIMPVYNGEKFIRTAIDSVLAQCYDHWELIVVNDGSTDETSSIVREYKDPRIILVLQENRGQATALNHGLRLAKGNYFTTLDADDWFTREGIISRVRFLDENPDVGAVYGNGMYCDFDGKPIMNFSEYRIGNVTGDVYETLITTPFFGTGGNVMCRMDVVRRFSLQYDESIAWCQDYDFYVRLSEHTTFGVIEEATLWYRLHDANMTMSMPDWRRQDALVRTKNKVLSSTRFSRSKNSSKLRFFLQFTVTDLAGRFNEQMAALKHPEFQSLTNQQKSIVFRRLALDYMLDRKEIVRTRQLLMKSIRLDPLNFRSVLLVFLTFIQGDRTENLIKIWLKHKPHSPFAPSPFNKIQS